MIVATWALWPSKARSLVGKYSCKYPYGVETVELKTDGRFSQTIAVSGRPVLTNSGEWTEVNGDIVLHDGFAIDDGFGSPVTIPRRMTWQMQIASSFRSPRFIVNEDLGYTFDKP
ncbi:MAG: hypothetical protein H7Z14_21285 [Anaerolineae bacterium]|nr:hypothetical protein [Phycisphaerae bacterium]